MNMPVSVTPTQWARDLMFFSPDLTQVQVWGGFFGEGWMTPPISMALRSSPSTRRPANSGSSPPGSYLLPSSSLESSLSMSEAPGVSCRDTVVFFPRHRPPAGDPPLQNYPLTPVIMMAFRRWLTTALTRYSQHLPRSRSYVSFRPV